MSSSPESRERDSESIQFYMLTAPHMGTESNNCSLQDPSSIFLHRPHCSFRTPLWTNLSRSCTEVLSCSSGDRCLQFPPLSCPTWLHTGAHWRTQAPWPYWEPGAPSPALGSSQAVCVTCLKVPLPGVACIAPDRRSQTGSRCLVSDDPTLVLLAAA